MASFPNPDVSGLGNRSWASRSALSVLISIAAGILTGLVSAWLGILTEVGLLGGVGISAWAGGWLGGLVSSATTTGLMVALVSQQGSFHALSPPSIPAELMTYLPASLFVAWVGSYLRTVLRKAHERNVALRDEAVRRVALEHRLLESNDSLAASNAELALAVEARDRFLAQISHEIRTPLNGVLGMLRVLAGTGLTARQREYTQGATRSGVTLMRLLNELLDIGLLARTSIEPKGGPFDLASLTQEVVETYAPMAAEKSVAITSRYAKMSPRFVIGDALALHRVLNNLVHNAVKFTSRGSVRLEVDGEMHVGERVDLRFSVADTGLGIDEGELLRIFDGGGRIDAGERMRRGGAGLGLGMVRGLVEEMGGKIGVTSRAGVGTRFEFDIQLRIDLRPRWFATLGGESRIPGVLLVGDEHVDVQGLVELLRRDGIWVDSSCKVDEASTWARDAACRRPYEVALLCTRQAIDAGELTLVLAAGGTSIVTCGLPHEDHLTLEHRGCRVVATFSSATLDELASCVRDAVDHGRDTAATVARRDGDSATAGAADRPSPEPEEVPLFMSDQLVLLVDDEPMNLMVLRELLRMQGIGADCASSGKLAMERLREGSYSVVFMDVRMPEMNGPDTARCIRSAEQTAGVRPVPIVATTANDSPTDRAECAAAGMNDFLTKPLDPSHLALILERWVPKRVPETVSYGQRPAQVEAHAGTDENGDDDLTSVFIEAGERRISDLRAAIANGDADGASLAVHTLKSMARHMGFVELGRVSEAIETEIRINGTGIGKELAHEVHELFSQACARLTSPGSD